jgi:hypothetical protein
LRAAGDRREEFATLHTSAWASSSTLIPCTA